MRHEKILNKSKLEKYKIYYIKISLFDGKNRNVRLFLFPQKFE